MQFFLIEEDDDDDDDDPHTAEEELIDCVNTDKSDLQIDDILVVLNCSHALSAFAFLILGCDMRMLV